MAEVSTRPSGVASDVKRDATFAAEIVPRLVPTTQTLTLVRRRTSVTTRPRSLAWSDDVRNPPRPSAPR